MPPRRRLASAPMAHALTRAARLWLAVSLVPPSRDLASHPSAHQPRAAARHRALAGLLACCVARGRSLFGFARAKSEQVGLRQRNAWFGAEDIVEVPRPCALTRHRQRQWPEVAASPPYLHLHLVPHQFLEEIFLQMIHQLQRFWLETSSTSLFINLLHINWF